MLHLLRLHTKSALTMTGQAATYTLLTAGCRACAYACNNRAMSQCHRPGGQLGKGGQLFIASEYNLQTDTCEQVGEAGVLQIHAQEQTCKRLVHLRALHALANVA